MEINTKNLNLEIAKEFGIPSSEVKKVIDLTFEFVRDTIKSGDEKAIRLKRFGIFVPKSKRKHSHTK